MFDSAQQKTKDQRNSWLCHEVSLTQKPWYFQASAADYDAVPIEEYGMAMLRGMGWKKDVGIGKTVQG